VRGTFCLVAIEKLRNRIQENGKTAVFKEEGCIVNLTGQDSVLAFALQVNPVPG